LRAAELTGFAEGLADQEPPHWPFAVDGAQTEQEMIWAPIRPTRGSFSRVFDDLEGSTRLRIAAGGYVQRTVTRR
jgi:hypothetical protein